MKNKQRKLPVGWRRLTPTEKIDNTTKCGMNDGSNKTDILCWFSAFASEYNKTVKQTYNYEGWIYIKPKKITTNNEQIHTNQQQNTTSPTTGQETES